MLKTPECIWNARAELGEGPIWSVKEQALYWVDILGHKLHRYSFLKGTQTWQFDQEISSLAEREAADGLIITQRHSFTFFNFATGEQRTLAQIEHDLPGNRLNDSKCDRLGRFWAGTMDFDCIKPTGSLYRLSPDGSIKVMDTGYPVTNGPAWSADYRTLYHNDSVNGRVYAFDFNLESGEISNKRVFLQFAKADGSPDGMTTDAEGGLWIAHWGTGKLTRHDPEGKVMHTITLPCSQVTSCAFGGPNLTTLFITSAAGGLSPQQLEREPLAGGLFAIDLNIAGVPANKFGG